MHCYVYALAHTACETGFYGEGCASQCQCRLTSECNTINGLCICVTGYTGQTCMDECPEGLYGDECMSSCQCSDVGTESCDHVNGRCYCLEGWRGLACETESKCMHQILGPVVPLLM